MTQIQSRYQGTIYYVSSFFLLLCIYLLTFPENRTESDDGYWYAQLLRDENLGRLFLPRNLFYLPFIRIIYGSLVSAGVEIDAFTFLCILSSLFASGTVLLFYYFLRKHLDVQRTAAMLSSLFLAFSYGFWRYAMEAEVYAMTGFLILLSSLLFLEVKSIKHVIVLSLLSSFTVLMYKAGFIVLLLLFPLFFLLKRKFLELLVYLGVCTIIVTVFYIYSFHEMTDAPETFIEHVLSGRDDETTGSVVASAFVIGSNQVATNWIYGFDAITGFIESKFPFKVIIEEKYIGNYGAATRIPSLMIFSGLVISVLLLGFFVIKTLKFRRSLLPGEKLMLGWLVGYGVFVFIFDPTSNEPWLLISIPLAALIGSYLFEPLVNKNRKLVLIIVVSFFILHNFMGGIFLIRDKESDYSKAKAEWIVNNAATGDLIGCLGPMSFVRYIRYHSEADVVNLEERWEEFIPIANKVLAQNNSIYLTEDVIEPPAAIEKRSKNVILEIKEFLKEQEGSILLKDESETKTYQLTKF